RAQRRCSTRGRGNRCSASCRWAALLRLQRGRPSVGHLSSASGDACIVCKETNNVDANDFYDGPPVFDEEALELEENLAEFVMALSYPLNGKPKGATVGKLIPGVETNLIAEDGYYVIFCRTDAVLPDLGIKRKDKQDALASY
ncbi:heat-inducible transcription repressor HrcA, partial [Striga asiatica]